MHNIRALQFPERRPVTAQHQHRAPGFCGVSASHKRRSAKIYYDTVLRRQAARSTTSVPPTPTPSRRQHLHTVGHTTTAGQQGSARRTCRCRLYIRATSYESESAPQQQQRRRQRPKSGPKKNSTRCSCLGTHKPRARSTHDRRQPQGRCCERLRLGPRPTATAG
jgi:hypothetical protein